VLEGPTGCSSKPLDPSNPLISLRLWLPSESNGPKDTLERTLATTLFMPRLSKISLCVGKHATTMPTPTSTYAHTRALVSVPVQSKLPRLSSLGWNEESGKSLPKTSRASAPDSTISSASMTRRAVPATTEPYPAISSLHQSTERLKVAIHTKLIMRRLSDSTTFYRTVMLSPKSKARVATGASDRSQRRWCSVSAGWFCTSGTVI
jgi:hypothetical protein